LAQSDATARIVDHGDSGAHEPGASHPAEYHVTTQLNDPAAAG
jgi:hypothetical protein